MGDWEEREHTADALIAVWGADLADLFATAARALFALLGGEGHGEAVTHQIELSAPDVETLLVDWLNELLYIAERAPLSTFDLFHIQQITPTHLIANVSGHAVEGWRTYVKAATFHNLAVRQGKEGYGAEITFDL